MSHSRFKTIGQRYFERFKCYPSQISTIPHPDTKIIWVIPCYNEPDVVTTLKSLSQNSAPEFPAEILIVINSSASDKDNVLQQNARSKEEIDHWIKYQQPWWLSSQIIFIDKLPPKHAGVGLARKIGMDEALRRFISIDYDGLIMNLDADCVVSDNYLPAIERAFLTRTPSVVTVYFEHDLSQIVPPKLKEGIIHYELFLRYYINGLRYANYPYAFHTVGSSMGCRASSYALSGGMNRKKAGEDFYFLHKVAPLGKIEEITSATVYPSARTSNRVPFGTGKAQSDWLTNSSPHHALYHPQSFEDLKSFFSCVPDWYNQFRTWPSPAEEIIPRSIQQFTENQNFAEAWNRLQASTRSWSVFQHRFFSWWNGFRVLKYIHATRDHFYSPLSSDEAGFRLLEKLCILSANTSPTTEDLLSCYRRLDQQKC